MHAVNDRTIHSPRIRLSIDAGQAKAGILTVLALFQQHVEARIVSGLGKGNGDLDGEIFLVRKSARGHTEIVAAADCHGSILRTTGSVIEFARD